MLTTAILIAIRLYRMNPLRPHCDSKSGVHTRLCRAIMPRLLTRVPGLNTSWDTGDKCVKAAGTPLSCGEQPSNYPNWRG